MKKFALNSILGALVFMATVACDEEGFLDQVVSPDPFTGTVNFAATPDEGGTISDDVDVSTSDFGDYDVIKDVVVDRITYDVTDFTGTGDETMDLAIEFSSDGGPRVLLDRISVQVSQIPASAEFDLSGNELQDLQEQLKEMGNVKFFFTGTISDVTEDLTGTLEYEIYTSLTVGL